MNKQQFLQLFHFNTLTQPHAVFGSTIEPKQAAVLMPIVERESGLYCVFTVRSQNLRHHAGQISFPGGRVDDDDNSLVEAALRETKEEIGIVESGISILGSLNSITTNSGYDIQPFIGFLDSDYQPKLNPHEVDEIFEVPLSFLLNRANHHRYHYKHHQATYPVYFIPYQGRNIWGATAAIIKDLSLHLHK